VIEVTTLTDGGQRPLDVATRVAGFLEGAAASLDVALYDLKLGPDTGRVVANAIEAAKARGVAVRVAYNADFGKPVPVPAPPQSAPVEIERLGVPTRAIPGVPDLMHHKYVVRDGGAVWTGSANWTDDSWSREENVLAVVESPALARAFALDFEQLWQSASVAESGKVEPRPVDVAGVQVRPWFCPGYGDALSHRIAKQLGRARRRIRICSPVLTAAPVLATLTQIVCDGRVDVGGALDQTQVAEVLDQWHESGVASWKLPLLERVLESGRFAGKRSTPWAPDAVHDYMHAKVTVADDVVFLGSFNLSHSGEQNAENVLEIHDAVLAERLAGFVDGVRSRYPPAVGAGRRSSGGLGAARSKP